MADNIPVSDTFIEPDDRILQAEAASILGVARQTVINDFRRGFLKKSMRTRSRRYFSREEVTAWAKQCNVSYSHTAKLPDA